MNNFCHALTDSLRKKFESEVGVFVSKQKKIVNMSLMKPLVSYKFFNEIIQFIKIFWYHKQKFYPGYFFIYPRLNQSLKWGFSYIIIGNNRYKLKKGFTSQGLFLFSNQKAQGKNFKWRFEIYDNVQLISEKT